MATLVSDYFDEMSGAKQSVIQILAGARKINGVIRPYDFAAASYLPIVTDFAPPDGTEPPLSSSFVDPLVNNPAGDGSQNTQSETTIALGTGTNVVSVFNDSGSDIGGATKFTGYGTSANSGTAWTDRGTLPNTGTGDAGDPVMARNTSTNAILLTTLCFTAATSLDVWRSLDSGVTFSSGLEYYRRRR